MGELELHHQGVSWDWDIAQPGVKEKEVKLHGVAMTVSGCELSRVVTPEPMTEYTESLKAFLLSDFILRMRPSNEAL